MQNMAHTPGNDPARVIYQRDAAPHADQVDTVIVALLQEENEQDGDPGHKRQIMRLVELQSAFAATRLQLRELLGDNGLDYEAQFRQHLIRPQPLSCNWPPSCRQRSGSASYSSSCKLN